MSAPSVSELLRQVIGVHPDHNSPAHWAHHRGVCRHDTCPKGLMSPPQKSWPISSYVYTIKISLQQLMYKWAYMTHHQLKGGRLKRPRQTGLQWSAEEVPFFLPQWKSAAVPKQAAKPIPRHSLPECLTRRWCPKQQLESRLIWCLNVNVLLAFRWSRLFWIRVMTRCLFFYPVLLLS